MAGEGDEDKRVAEYRAIEGRIRAAVEAGKISREDAEKKRVATRKHMFGGERCSSDREDVIDYDAIGRRIRAAVAAGRMTKEEAERKWAEIKKKAGAKTNAR